VLLVAGIRNFILPPVLQSRFEEFFLFGSERLPRLQPGLFFGGDLGSFLCLGQLLGEGLYFGVEFRFLRRGCLEAFGRRGVILADSLETGLGSSATTRSEGFLTRWGDGNFVTQDLFAHPRKAIVKVKGE
jgi:hypothetical protein